MKFFSILLLSTCIALIPATGWGQEIRAACFSDAFKTVQAYPVGNPLGYPLVELGTSEALEFHFDEMTTDLNQYNFAVMHCTHDWQLSDLDATEYLTGFPSQSITEYEAGFNTQIEFVHHRFTFPNDMMKPRYSGNYAVVVYSGSDAADQSAWLITYRMVVYEQQVGVALSVGTTQLIAQRYQSQDADVVVTHAGLNIIDPMNDTHLTLLQNMDWSTAHTDMKPQYIQNGVLQYDYNMGENTFMGGAEYRNYEVKSLQYTSMEVDHIAYEADGYHAYLLPDLPTAGKAYSTNTDLNGQYLVRCDEADDSHLEADYVWVHFSLKMPQMEEMLLMLEGDFTRYMSTTPTMQYDDKLNAYTCTLLLKQGYYNYRYTALNTYSAEQTLAFTEGNYSSTENTYHALLYLYDRALGCDRVVGAKAEKSVR